MNPDRDEIRALFEASKTIAVVGLSRDPAKPSRSVPEYLHEQGYRIIPINPHLQEALGERAYPSLRDLPADLAAEVDIVDIFRPSQDLPEVVAEALETLPNLRAVWAQLGIAHARAAELAAKAGVPIIQDRCIRTDHRMLMMLKG